VTDVRAFVASYLQAIGAGAEALSAGALAVRWPPTHAARFGPSTTVAFDPLVAEASNAELCVVGSDLLDRIVADASGRGFHCVALVDAENEPPRGEVLTANLNFPNARASIVAGEEGLVPYLLFNFRVTLTTDEKRELVRSILLNAVTLQEHPAVDIFLRESLTLPEAREDTLLAEQSILNTYRSACGALERAILREVEQVRGKASAFLSTELQRIDAFYENSIKELYAGRTQTPLEAEKELRAERERRVDEVRRKLEFSVAAKLINVRTILVPTVTLRVSLANSRASKDLDLEYDAVTLETNRPACESCRAPTGTIHLCSRGHIACDACERRCDFCDEVVCSKCAPEVLSPCASCIRKGCPDHTFVDEIGRKTYCQDHIHTCAICRRMVGPPYVKPCRVCSQSYCAVCVEEQGRCTTCRTLAAVADAHKDVARVQAFPGAPKGVRWLRGQNGEYTILLGKGAVFQHLFVLDSKGALVHRRKGRGIAG